MIGPDDVGGVHIKYLYHCPRQLWLYARGMRPEHLSSLVQLGEAIHATSYRRASPIDLGAARLDHLDGEAWVHEIKSSAAPTEADRAQALHYCYRLRRVGVETQGAVLHYPKTRRTERIPYTTEHTARAEADIAEVVRVVSAVHSPPPPPRVRCKGCSFFDYCWNG